ncbi:MAG: response regulator [Alphaproteobacteria bacterium]|nr:response regulator [Alphaproteobacteria bacterium]
MAHSTIFVIEDDAVQRKALTLFLEGEGLTVRTFATARDFLESVEPSATGCVISDLRLSELSAIDLMREMTAKGFQMPVIICTGDSSPKAAEEMAVQGCYHFLIKPFEPAKLIRTILAALNYRL